MLCNPEAKFIIWVVGDGVVVGFLWPVMLIARFCSPGRCDARPVQLYENHVVVEVSLLAEDES